MALAANNGLATFDQTTNKRLDISPVLSAILLNDKATLGVVGEMPSVMRSDHKWGSDSLNAPTVTLANSGNVAAVDTSIVVSDASKITIGALLMCQESTKKEVVQVTNIVGNTLTITRDYDGGGAVIFLDTTELAVIGQPNQEGAQGASSIAKDRVQDFNYTQIFRKTVFVTGTQEAEANNGVHPGVDSEVRHQLAYRAMELSVELNRSILNSYRSGPGAAASYRSLGGIRQFLELGGNERTVSEAIDEDAINAIYKLSWDKGGNPTTLIGNDGQINAFTSFNSNRFRVAPSDRVVGTFIEKYLTEYGAELTLVLDRWARQDEVYLIDPSKMGVAMLNGRGLTTKPLADEGDNSRWQMLMEATFICENKGEAHAFHSALT